MLRGRLPPATGGGLIVSVARAAVPLVEPQQLVVIAIGRIFRVKLGGERFGAGQPFFRGGDEVAGGKRGKIGRVEAVASAHRTGHVRSEEHTSELQSLMRISYAVFCLKKKIRTKVDYIETNRQIT